MSKDRDRMVSQRSDGTWQNKRNDASRATSVHRTQVEAQDAARANLKNQGGGELTTLGTDGRIRDKDTVAPGNDPTLRPQRFPHAADVVAAFRNCPPVDLESLRADLDAVVDPDPTPRV